MANKVPCLLIKEYRHRNNTGGACLKLTDGTPVPLSELYKLLRAPGLDCLIFAPYPERYLLSALKEAGDYANQKIGSSELRRLIYLQNKFGGLLEYISFLEGRTNAV